MSGRWGEAITAAKQAAIAGEGAAKPAPVAEAANDTPPQPAARPRMIDRRDGPPRLEYVNVDGKIRGGKRSDKWGRPRNGASREGWVGVCLPPETRKRLKRLQAQHDLYEWQVLVEAIDLFAKTHGDGG